MLGTDAGNPPGHDLGPLRNELRKQFHVFVINRINALDAELANFLAPKILLWAGRPLTLVFTPVS